MKLANVLYRWGEMADSKSIPPSNPCLVELSSHLFLTKKYDKASFTLKDGEDY
jgi:hypothetical protein